MPSSGLWGALFGRSHGYSADLSQLANQQRGYSAAELRYMQEKEMERVNREYQEALNRWNSEQRTNTKVESLFNEGGLKDVTPKTILIENK